jgi:hypothetical protein
MAQEIGLTTDLTIALNFRHFGSVMGSAEGRSLVTVASLRIRHGLSLLLLSVKGVLAKSWVVLHKLKPRLCIALVLRSRVVILSVFRAHDTNDFSGF